ncbi:Lin1 family protein [Emericellopsis atlantica]|uniref:Lin1 family protein n=1 Tax=Emericellopsis atlantica TaxID=2614577 RepID=A0A9P8CTB1_9HYPO|nr:Lin1 family protein [Emericellopsis atlantica]KAG9258060.1 Lin1 family protein [Emericellopsis atlantica]
MASRFSAARPSREGEVYARAQHNDSNNDSTNLQFDVRNPSNLAPEAREDDAILEADVIGGGRATKRGAVNVDGYDSDSDNDTFNDKAQKRKKGDVNIGNAFGNYDASGTGPEGQRDTAANEDDDDMFAPDDDAAAGADTDDVGPADVDAAGIKPKHVKFLDADKIEGQVSSAHLDHQDSSDDEEDVALAVQEEGIDEEVGAGGLKRNAPKLEGFNLQNEMEEGKFDEQGNYVRRAGDPDAVHDNWLEGTSKKAIRKAAEAHQKREAEARQQRLDEDNVSVSDLLRSLILQLDKAETPLEALARLGKSQKPKKKIPSWKLKKMKKDTMDVDQEAENPEQAKIKESIRIITDASDKLLSRDHEEIYDQEREILVREWSRETGEDWVEPRAADTAETAADPNRKWLFRWVDGRDDGATQGPFDGSAMKAWQDAGYFGEGVEFRADEEGASWTRVSPFAA